MDEMPKPELKQKPEWLFCHAGFTIHTHPGLANGWIELHDEDGNVLASVNNVKAIYLARQRR